MSYAKEKWTIGKSKTCVNAGSIKISIKCGPGGGACVQVQQRMQELMEGTTQLVAAAPAMYEALCEAKRLLICEYGNRGYEVNYGRVIDAAIQQAEGGE